MKDLEPLSFKEMLKDIIKDIKDMFKKRKSGVNRYVKDKKY